MSTSLTERRILVVAGWASWYDFSTSSWIREAIMKCPKCWAEKAWKREVHGVKRVLLATLCVVPMRCHHCYHSFHIPWFYTIGRSIEPPQLPSELKIHQPSADFAAGKADTDSQRQAPLRRAA
ncbi:MAG: hypothetical protein DWQ31_21395 [Planctomycetota bacterium]|nr:MAG: hypothetical protein DWQ31_21395 [Planctomycetota bacterium]REJ93661.1 MAG: hypothetical protein DWQ35_09930 [Planctomycetota bacterium]REK25710.1 MAG: hypothetical protein DWQ42_10670 [Planctomycetota bacterium]REK46544.1 MAG: hypothetical protein DWQ46_06635 [Planctomycetota bacterium]